MIAMLMMKGRVFSLQRPIMWKRLKTCGPRRKSLKPSKRIESKSAMIRYCTGEGKARTKENRS